MKLLRFVSVLLVALSFSLSTRAQVRLSEFMASNASTLTDEDGDYSDWIEIQNTSGTNVNLLNWSLSDSSGNPGKWRFPATNLPPKSFLIVFTDNKNRVTPGAPLHTNFKLSSDGEYLALFAPDGSVATEITPQYPAQFPDVSYGIGMQLTSTPLVATNAAIHYLIPTNAAVDATWTQLNFSDVNWSNGLNGIGYETGIIDPQEETFAAKLLATQPVAYWRLNETSGTAAANAGTDGVQDQGGYLGSFTLGQAGPRPPQFPLFEATNNAPLFDGSSAYVNGPYQLVDDLPAFTIAGWIYPTATQNARAGLFGQNDTMEFGFSSSTEVQIWTPNGGSVTVTYPFPTNQWHYIMAVGTGSKLSVYFDGKLTNSTSASTSNYGESEYNFNIGGGGVFDASGDYFKGQIDEVAVWFRALATNEITALLATNADFVSYTNYLSTNVRTPMYGSNATAYVRIPFTVANTNAFDSLQLLMRYDDGFAAYLNGHLIASANAPGSLAWNSTATQRHLDTLAVQWSAFDVSAARTYLQTGNNVLAIQALNIAATNTDFLMQAQLVGQSIADTGLGWRYFTGPTPGAPNGTSTNDFGPIMSGASHLPNVPTPGQALAVSAQVVPGFNALTNVTLHYRVMFNAEIATPMSAVDTNGNWSGTIPGGLATAGQMIRYYVTATDVASNLSRWPFFANQTDSQQYYGTVVADASIQSHLPVAYLFVQNTNAADTQTGTSASLFYLNELYDNLNIYVHGQSSVGWPKNSHNLDFPGDHKFLYASNGYREDKIIFLSNYGDKSRMHTTLTYAMTALSGGAGFFSFPIRVQQNGSFWGIEDMVEHGDDLWLSRIGRDPDGALYKMYNNLSSASGNEKKTREDEGTDDLNALVTNLNETIPLATRITYGYDNLDLPQTASYFADMAICSSQDLGHKNYYLYRDTDNTGEWAIIPWDVDLTWGRDWLDSAGYFTDTIYTNNVLNFYNASQQSKPANPLFDLFFASSDFQQMYLRRLRTLMDTILMTNGTPTNALVLEPLIRQYEAALNPTNISPSDTALDYAAWGPTWGTTSLSIFPAAAEQIVTTYLPGRRNFLYNPAVATLNGSSIPAAQPANAVVLINATDYHPASGNIAEQYVQLLNTNNYAVDVSGWHLIGSIAFTMVPGTVIPAGKSLYLAANVNAFRARIASPHAGQNLFVQGPFGGFLSTSGNSPLILQNASGALVSQNSFAGNETAASFVAGNLAVLRLGNGTETLGSSGNSVFIDQFTTNGTLAGSIAIPNNSTNALLVSGNATSEGALSRSPDGRLLILAGYNIALTNAPTSSLSSATAATVPRAVGVLDAFGGFALSGVTTTQFSANNLRGGTSDGRGNYWGAGANAANSGTFYFGSGPTNTIQTTVANSIAIQDLGGNLYFTTAKTTPGIWKISGTPTGPATATSFLSASSKASPYAFALNATATTAYIADDTLKGSGGVQRWDFNGAAWTMTYAFNNLTNSGARGLAVDFRGANPIIYATTAIESSTNRLVALTDTGAASAMTTLATAGVNQIFRGVTFAPDAVVNPQIFGTLKKTNNVTLTTTALLNQNYTVQWTDNLLNTNWTTLMNLTATFTEISVTDTNAPANTNRFYRIILNP